MVDFLDKVVQGVGKGLTTVSVRSKEAVAVARIRGEIAAMQAQRRGALEELGSIVFTMSVKGLLDEKRIKEKCEAIRRVDGEIRDKEGELTRAHATAEAALGKPRTVGRCECGAPIVEGAKFCVKCGSSVVRPGATGP